MLWTAAAQAFAGGAHSTCAAKQHECGRAATITSCCCLDQDDTSSQGGPVESRAQISTGLTIAPAPAIAAPLPDVFQTIARPHTTPPRAAPLDLPTLFASLLI